MGNTTTNMGSSQTVSNSGHFSDYEFLPAVIVETDDPLKYGRIKVTALGAYNANKSLPAQLPWCYPFTMWGNNTYTTYEKGSKVWLIRNKKRQDENWFIPMYEQHGMTQDFVNNSSHSDKPEIISMRNKGGEQSSITYDHTNGYKISTGGSGGGAGLNIGTDSTAVMNAGESIITANNNGVSIGKMEETEHPSVLGDKLKELFQSIFKEIYEFANALSADPYAKVAAGKLAMFANEMQKPEKYNDILSDIVKIVENK